MAPLHLEKWFRVTKWIAKHDAVKLHDDMRKRGVKCILGRRKDSKYAVFRLLANLPSAFVLDCQQADEERIRYRRTARAV